MPFLRVSKPGYTNLFFCLLLLFSTGVYAQTRVRSVVLANEKIKGTISMNGLSSLVYPPDTFGANVIGERSWGRTKMTYKVGDGSWLDIFNGSTRATVNSDSSFSIINYESGMPQKMEQRYSLTKDGIDLDISIESMMQFTCEIGDLAVNFPFRRPGGGDAETIFERSFVKHHFIAGAGSFLFFAKPSGQGLFLMVLPKKGTKIEYFDDQGGDYKVYVHSRLSGNAVAGGTWRQEHTGVTMGPAGSSTSHLHYGFKFRWANSHDDMRKLLYEEGLYDIRVVPGMTIPTDLKAQFAIHTKNKIDSISAEFPGKTTIKFLGEKQPHQYIYEVNFQKLGENRLTIYDNEGMETYLEFFSTEPLETLVKKRSSFLVNHQLHRDTSKWYNGLFSIYDMKTGVLRSPDDADGFEGWWAYVLASDDPILGKAPYVAVKNVFFPDDKEIEAVEYHLKNFVWGKLQRTDKETPYPYGIHGVPNWKVARDINARAGVRARQLDRMQVWRTYDYPHMIMLYYHMYEIAKMYPAKVQYLDSTGYLERAYQTARAFFLYPYEIWGDYYRIYEHGFYNELLIEKLITALESKGRKKEADWLRNEYEKKVKFFIYDNKYPYGSEYSFDRTAFESSYAFAKYGTLNKMLPDTNLWYDKNEKIWRSHPFVKQEDARNFMGRQHYAGLSVRGWLEPKYYQLGADGSMSYMAKMGGWSVLDYGINFAEKPYDWLQLGYASYLSSWALMNTGTAESNYGFWAPGKKNDGAMGWAFIEAKRGRAWIGKDMDRGAWYYDGEADLGLGAGIRMATTILTNDPLFGWIAYGGVLDQTNREFSIIPKDGLRARFSLVSDNKRISIELNRDGFAKYEKITVDQSLKNIKFNLENRTGDSHRSILTVYSLFAPGKKSKVLIDGKPQKLKIVRNGQCEVVLTVIKPVHKIEVDIL